PFQNRTASLAGSRSSNADMVKGLAENAVALLVHDLAAFGQRQGDEVVHRAHAVGPDEAIGFGFAADILLDRAGKLQFAARLHFDSLDQKALIALLAQNLVAF